MADGEKGKRPSGLGRGLSALLGDPARPIVGTPAAAEDAGAGRPPLSLPIDRLVPNPRQPRRRFEPGALEELIESVKARGILQPILVRPLKDGRYEIVAGERRWRAAQGAQLHDIPAVVREMSEVEAYEVALIENIQRADLNPIEEAEGFQRLIGDFGHSQDALGRLVGKSRSHVANLMRLLELPEPVREHVREGRLAMGHARALITAADPVALAEEVIKHDLSVRQVEALARASKAGAGRERAASKTESSLDADIAALQRQLADALGLGISVKHGEKGGTVTLAYSSLDQLDMICQRLSGGSF